MAKPVYLKTPQPRKGKLSEAEYAKLYATFTAAITKFDCGKKCSPLNGRMGPICCDTNHAVPVGEKAELATLQKRTDLWHPFTRVRSKALTGDMQTKDCLFECRGAHLCERENRSISCRTFPFFPYYDRQNVRQGLSVYWAFKDRCWLISNLQIVQQQFIDQFLDCYDFIFERDVREIETYQSMSISARRFWSKLNMKVPLITPDNKLAEVEPKTGAISFIKQPVKHEPFRNGKEYRQAIYEANGRPPKNGLLPELPTKE